MTQDTVGRIVEAAWVLYRADRFVFTMTSFRGSDGSKVPKPSRPAMTAVAQWTSHRRALGVMRREIETIPSVIADQVTASARTPGARGRGGATDSMKSY